MLGHTGVTFIPHENNGAYMLKRGSTLQMNNKFCKSKREQMDCALEIERKKKHQIRMIGMLHLVERCR